MSRIEFFRDRFYWKYGFSLTAHEFTLKFFCQSKEDATKWYTRLKKMCEVTVLHFSRDFVLGKLISKNNFSKIRLAASTNKDGNNKFSVKSISKSDLIENPQVLVIISY